MIITWKDSLSIDGGIIDEDHKILIILIGELLTSIKLKEQQEIIRQKLNTLKIYATKHFEREQFLQEISGFPECGSHKILHKQLLDELIGSIKDLIGNSENNGGGETTTLQFSNAKRFLNKWLIAHIMSEDVKMKPYVSAMSEKADHMLPLSA